MTDFWEAIGRMAYDGNLQRDFYATQPNPPQPVPTTKAANGNTALDIKGEDYQRTQEFFENVLTQRLLSLMAAGELIRAASFADSRTALAKIPAIISGALPGLVKPTTNFYIALGMLIIDEDYRAQLRTGKVPVKSLPPMSSDEQDQLMKLLQSCDGAARDFCASPWGGGCTARHSYWDGHLHPEAALEYGTVVSQASAAAQGSSKK
jgi:hypothetical protein